MNASLDVEIALDIARPPDEVWRFVSDAERLSEWLTEMEGVVKVSDGPVGEGTVFRYTVQPGHRSGTVEYVEWEPPRRLAWDGPPLGSRGGAARPRGSFEVSESGDGGTRLVSRYQPELTGLLAVLRSPLRRWLRKTRQGDTQRLKELLEARP